MTDRASLRPLALIVEDEAPQMEMLAYALQANGFDVVRAADGEEGLLVCEEAGPDIVLLDWMLPDVSGIEVCRRLRQRPASRGLPIVMLTARGEEADRVRGLDTGADDYIVKPYSTTELVARLRALLRRARPAAVGQVLEASGLRVDTLQHRVTCGGEEVHLGPTEYRLLCTLMEQPGRVWSRVQLLDLVWGRDREVDDRTVDVHVGRLRKALKACACGDPVRTVRGAGYALRTG